MITIIDNTNGQLLKFSDLPISSLFKMPKGSDVYQKILNPIASGYNSILLPSGEVTNTAGDRMVIKLKGTLKVEIE